MDERHFNLVDEPWLKVINQSGEVQMVSLATLFAHAHEYRRLGGDTRSQDLAIFRLLLALLHAVYSRADAQGRVYSWLHTDPMTGVQSVVNDVGNRQVEQALFQTWQDLFEGEAFTSAVRDYLELWHERFDFFGERPFYQATGSQYDQLVLKKNQVSTGTGTVALRQINRRVSESGNTPAVFSPKTEQTKDQLSVDELIRWVITYQNYTGVTDKSKILTNEAFSKGTGWLYKLNPVLAKGNNLFETLMLNLILVDPFDHDQSIVYHQQRPQWEWPSVIAYVEARKRQSVPDNLAELYTAWSRMLHIQWDESNLPVIFSAGLPMFDHENAFFEPMTTWHSFKKNKAEGFLPATKRLETLDIAMWRQFGQYVPVGKTAEEYEPGIVTWLRSLKKQRLIDKQRLITLQTVALISEKNPASQAPAAELIDDFQVRADVIFDSPRSWPTRIDDTIETTQKVASEYRRFLTQVESLRNLTGHALADREQAKLYEALNLPFKAWLRDLVDEDRDAQIEAWYQTLQKIVDAYASGVIDHATSQEMRGKMIGKKEKKYYTNIFIANNVLHARIRKILHG